jgi:nucleotide-binding universal stress UspA family protein
MPEQFQRLVVPVHGGPGDDRAIEVAGRLSQKQPVAVTLIYVVEVLQSMRLDAELPTEIDRGETILRHAEESARRAFSPGKELESLHRELLQARAAGAAIVDEAIERGASAIVMAARMRTRHGKVGFGETVPYVLKHAPCEVILVRQAPAQAASGVEAKDLAVPAGGRRWR